VILEAARHGKDLGAGWLVLAALVVFIVGCVVSRTK
jgi:diacylglycerol kinase